MQPNRMYGGAFLSTICRCCLRRAGDVELTQRSVVGLAWLYANECPESNYAEHLVWVCQFCSMQLRRCIKFVETFRRSTRKLIEFLRDNEVNQDEKAIFLQTPHENNFLSKQCTGKIDLPSEMTVIAEVSNCFVIEYPKTRGQDDRRSFTEEVKVELLPYDDEFKVEMDFADQNLVMDAITINSTVVTSEKKKYEVHDKFGNKSIIFSEDNVIFKCKKSKATVDKVSKRKNKKTHCKSYGRLSRTDLESKMSSMKFSIIYLNRQEQLQEIENNKRSEKYLNAPHKCDFCGTGFVLIDSYENHMFKHTEARGAYQCDICLLRFPRATLLQCHRRDHARHFRCTLCGGAALSYTDCDRHYARCAGYRGPVRCDRCGKSMRDTYSLQKHILLIHRSVKKFTCDYCQKDFKQKISLQNHIRRHTGERPYACSRCGQTFSSHYCLKQHALVHAPRGAHYCVECDTRYRSAASLRQHLARSPRHRSTRPDFKHACEQCDKRYYSKGELRTHVATAHTAPEERTPLQCPQCPKAYSREHVLRRHIRSVHHGVQRPRNHACQTCGKAFTERFRLANHARTHTGERPFPCGRCPATFAHKSAVYAHTKAKHPPPPPP